jgi:hypothetical protein
MVFGKGAAVKKTLLVVPAVLLALAGCEDKPAPSVSVSASQADLPSVAERWKGMTDQERKAVCDASSGPLPGEGEVGGTDSEVDYREMLKALEAAGYDQEEGAAMLPYALNECR